MQLFIDSANIEEIRTAHRWGVISGVTTNPSLVASEGRDFHTVIREIAQIVDGPISAEVVATDAAGMVEEGRALHALHPNVVVKVPMTADGLEACRALSRAGIPVNVTLVFSAAQGLMAALAGATLVSPFAGRLDDIGWDGMALVRELAEIFALHDLQAKVLAASVRHPVHVVESAKAGADAATVPFKVLQQMLRHPLTDQGLERFLADWRAARLRS